MERTGIGQVRHEDREWSTNLFFGEKSQTRGEIGSLEQVGVLLHPLPELREDLGEATWHGHVVEFLKKDGENSSNDLMLRTQVWKEIWVSLQSPASLFRGEYRRH